MYIIWFAVFCLSVSTWAAADVYLTQTDYDNIPSYVLQGKQRSSLFAGTLFEGDIDLKGLPLEAFTKDASDPDGTSASNAVRNVSLRWPNNRVPYSLNETFKGQGDMKAAIAAAFEKYHEDTCIQFVPRTADDQDYIHFWRQPSGCSSNVGKVGGKQLVKLGRRCGHEVSTIMHELMHVIGFWHEQSRNDRDLYVKIVEENVRSVDAKKNFKKYDLRTITHLGTPYDFSSLMHYPANAFSKSPDELLTIVPKDPSVKPADLGRTDGTFSKNDLDKINKLYPCGQTTSPVKPEPNIPRGCTTSTRLWGHTQVWKTDDLNDCKMRCQQSPDCDAISFVPSYFLTGNCIVFDRSKAQFITTKERGSTTCVKPFASVGPPPSMTTTAPRCEDDWTLVRNANTAGGTCIKKFAQSIDFTTAMRLCQTYNGWPVKIESAEKNNVVKELITDVETTKGSYVGYRIGVQRVNGQYEWYDGSPATFTKWNNNHKTFNKPTAEENCAFMTRFGAWYATSCNRAAYFICEKPMV